jgi:HD-GYP domain-containing protein (c-di-GMP phosphodiesterase class II)
MSTLQMMNSNEIKLSEVISALSYALDITEGQPPGHSTRSCILGMRLAAEIGLSSQQRSALFYALLLKDAGCSSNAAKVSSLFDADDHWLKRDTKIIDWSNLSQSLLYVACHAAPQGSVIERIKRIFKIGLKGPKSAKQLVEIRCERGADIARMLNFPQETSEAIRALDEHWDGKGYPRGLKGQEIPLLGRIMCLAQTVEVFFRTYGMIAAFEIAQKRRGKWFDPDLVDVLFSISKDKDFWQRLYVEDPHLQISALEPVDCVLMVNDTLLDRVVEGFARVIDAKSYWTYRHSERVAEIAVGMGEFIGFSNEELRDLKRAALLHDIGKLGVSNLILDKPGRLTEDERNEMCRHTKYTQDIIGRVANFHNVMELACSHHERLDGRGYHRQLSNLDLSSVARVLPVADIYEALTANRPYRKALPQDQALKIMRQEVGTGLCPRIFEVLEFFLEKTGYY